MELRGRVISGGSCEGTALVTREPISFFGGVDPDTGVVVDKGHELEGQCVSGRVLVFPRGKGSTVGSYVLYRMAKQGTAPAGLVNVEAETIVAVGAIIASIPLVDELDGDPLEVIVTGQRVKIIGGVVEVG
ncbi:MAG: DUF126 domain-containing protein [Promethearchaeota archaeon]